MAECLVAHDDEKTTPNITGDGVFCLGPELHKIELVSYSVTIRITLALGASAKISHT